jgi:hypothetical protein
MQLLEGRTHVWASQLLTKAVEDTSVVSLQTLKSPLRQQRA